MPHNARISRALPPGLRLGRVAQRQSIYVPVLMRDDLDGILYQAGAFPTEAEAQKVLDGWARDGRPEPMFINVVRFYATADEWEAERRPPDPPEPPKFWR